ncbi:hypothetical protein RJ40_01495 [Methanofollis aquaemaris]|uniref:Uncharacterized protein n=1 Tax=Methanofollis aquaemaris TaxID=126734 RepID=A0A8A3S3U0_9EURY|nr:hypothetical protein [Methanofollis aquaemaris]QSZ66264.1 hypothetical protein RJ40_01495 [Methanofollis aquaemaris]
MNTEQTLQDLVRLLPASLLAGILGGGMIVFLRSYVYDWCWYDLLSFEHGIFFTIGCAHTLVLCFLTLFLAGMVAVALYPGKNRAQAAFAGGVSGCMACFVFVILTLVSDLLSHGSVDLVGDLIFHASLILSHALSLMFLTLTMVVLAVLGALIFFSSLEKATTPEENARASRLVLGSTVLIILVFMFLPPLVAHAMPGTEPTVAAIGRSVISVERTAPDTIVLTAQEVPATSVLTDPHFSVYLDGVEASNATVAAANGLAVTVEPVDGLLAFEGSRATWQGTAVHNNGTPVNVAVAAQGADGSKQFVFDRQV